MTIVLSFGVAAPCSRTAAVFAFSPWAVLNAEESTKDSPCRSHDGRFVALHLQRPLISFTMKLLNILTFAFGLLIGIAFATSASIRGDIANINGQAQTVKTLYLKAEVVSDVGMHSH